MKPIAVILSGCGVFDGTEVNEAVLTLLSIEQLGAKAQCLAPNIEQAHVVNHLTQEPTNEKRNVLVESARIARGDIQDIASVDPSDFSAAILVGGFGAAKNLCNFAFEQDVMVNQPTSDFVKAIHQANKPLGFMCIAPVIAAKLFLGVKLTIGSDSGTAKRIESMGAIHAQAQVDGVVVDKDHKIVTTPAYMLAQSVGDAYSGIYGLLKALLALQSSSFE